VPKPQILSLGVVAHCFNRRECKPLNQPVKCVVTDSCPDFFLNIMKHKLVINRLRPT
jgi:hypothetical protein